MRKIFMFEPQSKASNLKVFVIGLVLLILFVFLVFKDIFLSIVLSGAFILFLLPPFLMTYYKSEINDYLDLNLGNGLYHTYQSSTLGILSLSSVSLSVLLVLLVLSKMGVYMAILIAIVCALPFLGIGLRFRTFHDDSRYVGDNFEIGYPPFYYIIVLAMICFIGYGSLFYGNSLVNSVVVFLVTNICYLLVIFPDKLNNILPFDNRTKLGFVIYVGFILVSFVVCAKFLIPYDFFLSLGIGD